MDSPYKGLKVDAWESKTEDLIKKCPVKMDVLVEVTLEAWEDIKTSKIGEYQIGVDVYPTQQVVGFMLEQLVALKLQKMFPEIWKHGTEKDEKDVVCLSDSGLSFEMKTSSHKTNIFGNRSYSKKTKKKTKKKVKDKSGYYLTANCERFRKGDKSPEILILRFGWVDHKDWAGQASETGQAATFSADVRDKKLKIIHQKKEAVAVKLGPGSF